MSAQPLRFIRATDRRALLAVVGLLVGCGGHVGQATTEDERGSVGVPPPPIEYCQGLGYTMMGSQCQFPDGTSCEQWSFFRGSCGEAHSYCNLHGGRVSSKTQDMGTWTAIYAVCDLGGKQCTENSFFHTGKCEYSGFP